MADVLIIGGGVIGLMTAFELLQAGQSVTVLDRQAVGQEASWAGGGILSPLYPWRFPAAVNNLAAWSTAAYPELAERLAELSGIDPEWTQSGMLVLDADEEKTGTWADRYQQPYEWRDAEGVAALEPALAQPPARGLWLPAIAQVRNPRLVKALKAVVLAQGAELREGQTVTGFRLREGRIHAVQTGQGDINADKVIVCGGAWTGDLIRELDPAVRVEPVKGQMLMFKAEPGLVRHIVLDQDHYVIPRRDGRILAGSTLEHSQFDKSTTPAGRDRLYQAATRLIPALGQYPLERHWAGLRPGTADGIPYICAHPRIEGLYINAGHYRNGVVLAPASARLMADLVLGRETIVEKGDYGVTR
jgi:glycine oxidase